MARTRFGAADLWRVKGFDGGLVTTVEDRLLQQNQAADLKNVVFDKAGALQRRKGHTPLSGSVANPGTFLGWWTEGRFVYVDDAGSIYVWDDTGPDLAQSNALTANADHDGYAFNGRFYVHNRSDGAFKVSTPASATSVSGHPKASYSTTLRDRVFVGNIVEDGLNFFSRIRFSDIATSETWNQNNDLDFIDVVPDDLDEISGLEAFQDRLVIFKKNSIYLMAGHTRDSFVIVPISAQRGGCPYPRTVSRGFGGIYFFGNDGVKRFEGKSIKHLSTVIDPIPGTPIAGTYANQRYYLVVNDSGTRVVYVYDEEGEWWTKYQGIPVDQLITDYRTDETSQRVYGLSNSEGKILQLEEGTTDDGTQISAFWESGWKDLGVPEVSKRTHQVNAILDKDSGPVSVLVSKDWESQPRKIITVQPDSRAHRFRRVPGIGSCRALRLRVENHQGEELNVSGLTVSYTPRGIR